MSSRIWLSPPHLTSNENLFIEKALLSNWITTSGDNVNQFEIEIAKYLNSKASVIALNSGTSAIHLALERLGVGYGDEVICSTFTFCASANPIIYQKAKPIFIDSENETWNMNPFFLKKAIKDRIKINKKPKAIIVVDSYGMPAKWEEINIIANEFEIPLIQDSAAAMGSMYKEKMCGLFGDLGVFSFNGNKIITTSSGGALILNNNQNKNAIISKASQSKINKNEFIYKDIGYNYRMSNVLAALGRAQLQELSNRVYKRREINSIYRKELKSKYIKFLKEPSDLFYSNHWLSCMLLDLKELKLNIYEVIEKFNNENIEVRRLWTPLHLQSIYKDAVYYGEDVAVKLYEKGFCLPSSSNLTTDEQMKIINLIKNKVLK